MFELGEFLANWLIEESQFGWHFHVEMSQGIVAPVVPCPSTVDLCFV